MIRLPKIPKGWENDITKLPVVSVEWVDATTVSGWKSYEYIQESTMIKVKTVGFLLPPTKDSVRLVPSITDNGEFSGVWLIPKKWIRSVKRIK